MVLFVFQLYQVCYFGKFINFGLGTVRNFKPNKNLTKKQNLTRPVCSKSFESEYYTCNIYILITISCPLHLSWLQGLNVVFVFQVWSKPFIQCLGDPFCVQPLCRCFITISRSHVLVDEALLNQWRLSLTCSVAQQECITLQFKHTGPNRCRVVRKEALL